MKRSNSKSSRFTLAFLGLAILLFFFFTNKSVVQSELPVYYTANVAYNSGKYQEALREFNEAVKADPGLIRQDPLLNFKIGYSLYRSQDWARVIPVMESGRKPLRVIEDYLVYFQVLASLQLGDTAAATNKIHFLEDKYQDSPLNDLTDSLRCGIFLKRNQADSALFYLKRMLRSGKFEKTEIYLNIIRLLKQQGDLDEFRKYSLIFIRTYPFHNRSGDVYKDVLSLYDGQIPDDVFESIMDYLFTTSQFLSAENLVSGQSRFAITAAEKDYFNWLPVEIAYRQGEFKRVLDWCLNQRGFFKSSRILREIDLHIARCYLRIGQVDKSIKAYLAFQQRYPSDVLSPEVLWKVAWLYEDGPDLHNAIKTYHKLVRTYRRTQFRDEAYFRIGLDYYRLKNYNKARAAWEDAVGATKDRFQKDRLLYWIGKSYEKQQNYQKQGELLIELAKRPVDSYYNLKAFFLTSNGRQTHKQISDIFWQLHEGNQSYLPGHISEFRRALLVKEILGRAWSDRELQALEFNANDWQRVYALGELHERMGNYGRAYRKFRSIFNAHFFDAALSDMVPVFKKLYPFYFTNIVDSMAGVYDVPPALILSVMKKESAFEPSVISYANAYGLMQLLPNTASQIAPKISMRYSSTRQLFNPQMNITMGTYYLSSLLHRYHGNYVMALAAYNAGPHRVDRWKNRYPTKDDDLFMENLEFEQTRVYVRTCLKYFWIYREIMNPGEIPKEIVLYPVKLTNFF